MARDLRGSIDPWKSHTRSTANQEREILQRLLRSPFATSALPLGHYLRLWGGEPDGTPQLRPEGAPSRRPEPGTGGPRQSGTKCPPESRGGHTSATSPTARFGAQNVGMSCVLELINFLSILKGLARFFPLLYLYIFVGFQSIATESLRKSTKLVDDLRSKTATCFPMISYNDRRRTSWVQQTALFLVFSAKVRRLQPDGRPDGWNGRWNGWHRRDVGAQNGRMHGPELKRLSETWRNSIYIWMRYYGRWGINAEIRRTFFKWLGTITTFTSKRRLFFTFDAQNCALFISGSLAHAQFHAGRTAEAPGPAPRHPRRPQATEHTRRRQAAHRPGAQGRTHRQLISTDSSADLWLLSLRTWNQRIFSWIPKGTWRPVVNLTGWSWLWNYHSQLLGLARIDWEQKWQIPWSGRTPAATCCSTCTCLTSRVILTTPSAATGNVLWSLACITCGPRSGNPFPSLTKSCSITLQWQFSAHLVASKTMNPPVKQECCFAQQECNTRTTCISPSTTEVTLPDTVRERAQLYRASPFCAQTEASQVPKKRMPPLRAGRLEVSGKENQQNMGKSSFAYSWSWNLCCFVNIACPRA